MRSLEACLILPIAVTELNGHFVQEKPVCYRHPLGNALRWGKGSVCACPRIRCPL